MSLSLFALKERCWPSQPPTMTHSSILPLVLLDLGVVINASVL